MKQVKINTRSSRELAEDFIKTAVNNEFTYIGVGDKELSEKYRVKGVKQIRYCKEYLCFAYDVLGNKTVLTLDGKILQF